MKLNEKVTKNTIQMMEEEATEFMESYDFNNFIENCFYNEKIDMMLHAKIKEIIKDNIISTMKKNAEQIIINAIEKKEF